MLDTASGSKIGELDGNWNDFADHVEFAPDGESILVVAGARVFVTSSDLAADPRDIGEPDTVYDGATFSLQGDRVATLTSNGAVEVREGATGRLLFRLGEPSRVVRSLAFSPGPAKPRLLTVTERSKVAEPPEP